MLPTDILNKPFLNMTGAEILELAKEIGLPTIKRTEAHRGSGVGARATPKRETHAEMKKRVQQQCENRMRKSIKK